MGGLLGEGGGKGYVGPPFQIIGGGGGASPPVGPPFQIIGGGGAGLAPLLPPRTLFLGSLGTCNYLLAQEKINNGFAHAHLL